MEYLVKVFKILYVYVLFLIVIIIRRVWFIFCFNLVLNYSINFAFLAHQSQRLIGELIV